eukprot:COSAG01_NODE_1925_length_8884_cov_6.366648_8_plen_88_part_00
MLWHAATFWPALTLHAAQWHATFKLMTFLPCQILFFGPTLGSYWDMFCQKEVSPSCACCCQIHPNCKTITLMLGPGQVVYVVADKMA